MRLNTDIAKWVHFSTNHAIYFTIKAKILTYDYRPLERLLSCMMQAPASQDRERTFEKLK